MEAIIGCPGCDALTARIRDLEQRLEAATKTHAEEDGLRRLAQQHAATAERRCTELTAANQGWQMVEDERVKFIAGLEERCTELEALLGRVQKELGAGWANKGIAADLSLLADIRAALTSDSALPNEPRRVRSLDAIKAGTLVEIHGKGLGGGWRCTGCDWAITKGLPPWHECKPTSLPDEPPPAPLQPGAKCSNGDEFWCSIHCPLDRATSGVGQLLYHNCNAGTACCSEHCAPQETRQTKGDQHG
jgi:hypothetical protein